MSPARRNRSIVYALISVAALLATWSQNLAFFALPDNGGMLGFLRATTANPAAASITYDIGFFCLAAFVWMFVEARRLKIRHVWIYVALSLVVAVSVAFPLFLIARERALEALNESASPRA